MKFSSRKDILFTTIIIGVIAFTVILTLIGILKGEMQPEEYWVLPIIILFLCLVLWMFFGTNYELGKDGFIYRCGPINRKISIHRIREIVKGRTTWIGLKPATARNGLLIKYDKYNEVYISPKTNETFIKQLLELKNDIIISE